MGEELRIGIIGYGGFGRFLHRAWSGVQGAVVTHIGDTAGIVAPTGVTACSSWEQLVEDRTVDAVSIATPPASHGDIAVAALSRGLHVLVEKPVAITLADAERIIHARDLAGRVASVNFMLRFNPIISCIHSWCRSGVFGSLQRAVVENYAQDESLEPGHWFWDPAESGGILVEHGVHFFDIVNGATQADVTAVEGRSWQRNARQTDRVFTLVEYEDGLVASHYHAFNRLDAFERTTIRFVFDAAQIDIAGWIPMEGRIVALVNPETSVRLSDLPNLVVLDRRPVHATRQTPLAAGSRMANDAWRDDQEMPRSRIDSMVTAQFSIGTSKEEAYLSALRALMSDFLLACRNPGLQPAVTLEDGLAALRIALAASARPT